MKARKKENPEKKKIRDAAYRAANREEARKRTAAWHTKNPDRVKELKKAYAAAHPDRMKKAREAWEKAHPEKNRVKVQNYKARKRRNGGSLSPDIFERLYKFQRGKCAVCKVDLKKTSHQLDHIIPLARGGKNTDSNTQLTCPTCNQKKHAKDPIRFMQEMGYLL